MSATLIVYEFPFLSGLAALYKIAKKLSKNSFKANSSCWVLRQAHDKLSRSKEVKSRRYSLRRSVFLHFVQNRLFALACRQDRLVEGLRRRPEFIEGTGQRAHQPGKDEVRTVARRSGEAGSTSSRTVWSELESGRLTLGIALNAE